MVSPELAAARRPILDHLERLVEQARQVHDGEPNEIGIGTAAGAGVAICTVDGHVYTAGDAEEPFAIQSISKAFTYALALADRGSAYVDSKINVEPSGEAFNEISLDAEPARRPIRWSTSGRSPPTGVSTSRGSPGSWSSTSASPVTPWRSTRRSTGPRGRARHAIGHWRGC